MNIPQKIRTDKYGDIEVVMWFHEGPRPIALTKNGAYVFDSGLAVTEAVDLRTAIGKQKDFLDAALAWLDHKDDRIDGSIREIKLLHGKMMVYADDNSPVDSVEDIIAFFEPGPFRDAAFKVWAEMVAGAKESKLSAPLTSRPESPKKPKVKTTAAAPVKKPAASVKRPSKAPKMGAAEGATA